MKIHDDYVTTVQQYNSGFLPDIMLFDPMILPLGNPTTHPMKSFVLAANVPININSLTF